jgi:hypothetical protein
MGISTAEKRIIQRKAELELDRQMDLAKKELTAAEKRMMEAPEVIALSCEFLCVFIGIMLAVAGKAEAAVPPILIGIYLKLRR